MMETFKEYQLSHSQLSQIVDILLKIPKRHKLIHPCQQRTRYAAILQWLTFSITQLNKDLNLPPKDMADQQQQLVVSSLTELIELTRKECLEKGIILQMVLEYFISSINAYWNLFHTASKQMRYEYQSNAVKVQKDYMSELKRLQTQNDEIKKDKQHRWRNMFMLIKDNRIHRKRNKKLIKSIQEEIDKNTVLAEQMITLRSENEKLKLRVSYLENQENQSEEDKAKLQGYVQVNLSLIDLQNKIKEYPKKAKKLLKNDLLKIQISQAKGLQDKIKFIIKAIEQTGSIIDQIYDEDIVWPRYLYNISTQTDNQTQEKGVNTVSTKTLSVETETYPREHVDLDIIDTVLVKMMPFNRKNKDNSSRQSRNAMFGTQGYNKMSNLKQNDNKYRPYSRKVQLRGFSVCQSLKITINQGRIAYISTFSTQVFNGVDINQVEKRVRIEDDIKQNRRDEEEIRQRREYHECYDVYTQTEYGSEDVSLPHSHFGGRNGLRKAKISKASLDINYYDLNKSMEKQGREFKIICETSYCYEPEKPKQRKMLKLSMNSDKQTSIIRLSTTKKISKQKMQKKREAQEKESRSQIKFSVKKAIKNEFKEMTTKETEERSQTRHLTEIRMTQDESLFREVEVNLKGYKQNRQPSQSNTTKNTTKHDSSAISEITTPLDLPSIGTKYKAVPSILETMSHEKKLQQMVRNHSLVVSQPPLKKIHQSNRFPKLPQQRAQKHKRTITDYNEVQSMSATISQGTYKLAASQYKMRPLHRINEDVSEHDRVLEVQKPVSREKMSAVGFLGKEDLLLKDIDFNKGIDKMLKNMEVRHAQLVNNGYTFRTFLVSYFKCLYGKQLDLNFLNFLSNSSTQGQEIIICMNRLINSKLPQVQLVDLFRTFVVMLSKCHIVGESPMNTRTRPDILKYLVGQYFEEEEATSFEMRMKKQGCVSFLGWFNCLEWEVRKGAYQSQLSHFLSDILPESEDSLTYTFIQQLTFCMNDQETGQQLIKSKFQLGQKVAIHRFCLFCLKGRWLRMLNIETSIEQEYFQRCGVYKQQKAMEMVLNHQEVFQDFKNLDKCLRYWLAVNQKYGPEWNKHLLMLSHLIIVEVRLKAAMPLCRELRLINLAFEGLQKKTFYEQMVERREEKGVRMSLE